MMRWVCIYTRPRAEVTAKWAFDAGKLESFLPMARMRSHKRGEGLVIRPIFPRYVFACIELEEQVAWILQRREVVSILSHDGAPIPVPPRIIDQLKIAVSSGVFEERRDSGLQPGDRVRVSRGPLAEVFGTMMRLKARDRAEVLLKLFGHFRKVEIALDELSQISSGTRY